MFLHLLHFTFFTNFYKKKRELTGGNTFLSTALCILLYVLKFTMHMGGKVAKWTRKDQISFIFEPPILNYNDIENVGFRINLGK